MFDQACTRVKRDLKIDHVGTERDLRVKRDLEIDLSRSKGDLESAKETY